MSDGEKAGLLRRLKKENPLSVQYDYDDETGTSDDDKSTNHSITNFSSVIVDGLEVETLGYPNNNTSVQCSGTKLSSDTTTPAPPPHFKGLPEETLLEREIGQTEEPSADSCNGNLIERKFQEYHFNHYHHQHHPDTGYSQPLYSQISSKSSSSLEGTSLESESAASTVSFVTEIEVKCDKGTGTKSDEKCVNLQNVFSTSLVMMMMEEKKEEECLEGVKPGVSTDAGLDTSSSAEEERKGGKSNDEITAEEGQEGEKNTGTTTTTPTPEDDEAGEVGGDEDDEDDDTTTLSSEAVVDDIELILMPEMCQDLQTNLSPKLVRVTELKVNEEGDDVFDEDEDQSSRHEFRSIVDEVCEEEQNPEDEEEEGNIGRYSVGDDDVSSGSEFLGAKGASIAEGEVSKRSSSSSSGRRRRSTSGRISSGVQTEITAVEEPSALSSHHGFRKKTSGKSSARLGVPGGGGSGKKLNWKSELTLLPSKMKVKQTGYNSFESNDERDQYSPRVAKFTSQDTLNLSSQFLKPNTLYRTRNLSRNLNQFASSESTFMLPMSSDQQLSADSPRFRDRVSSSTSACAAGNFKGATTSHSAYQISSMLSGSGVGLTTAHYPTSGTNVSLRRPPLTSGLSGVSMMLGGSSSRHFRSSMPDLNAVNKSYPTGAATMADSHRRRPPTKSIKHHHSSSGFRLQKRSSSDEETSSLIDESERCLRSSIDLLLTDELPSPGGDSCFPSTGFGSSSLAAISTGFYSGRRSCSQPILNDLAYPPEMRDPSMGSPFLPRKLSDMRCSRWAKVILPNGHVAVVAVRETDEIQDTLTVHTDTGSVINLPFRKVVFAWKTRR